MGFLDCAAAQHYPHQTVGTTSVLVDVAAEPAGAHSLYDAVSKPGCCWSPPGKVSPVACTRRQERCSCAGNTALCRLQHLLLVDCAAGLQCSMLTAGLSATAGQLDRYALALDKGSAAASVPDMPSPLARSTKGAAICTRLQVVSARWASCNYTRAHT